MPEHKALAKYVKSIRDKNHESQEIFAGHCGLSKDFISLLEREKANPSLEAIQKIAAYTGDTVADILTIKENEVGKNDENWILYSRRKIYSG